MAVSRRKSEAFQVPFRKDEEEPPASTAVCVIEYDVDTLL